MPMRWRWPPENSCGYFVSAAARQPDRPAAARAAALRRGLVVVGQAVGLHALEQQRLHGLARVEAAHRVLEDHLDVLRRAAQRLAAEGGDVDAVEDDRALGRRLEVEDRPAEGRLAAAGLADQAVGLAAVGSAGRPRRRRRRSPTTLSKMTPRLIGKWTLTPLTSTRTSCSRRSSRFDLGHHGVVAAQRAVAVVVEQLGTDLAAHLQGIGAARRERARVVPRQVVRRPSRGWG